MPAYPELPSLIPCATGDAAQSVLFERVVPYLVEVWLADYRRWTPCNDIVETTSSGFSYLFDVQHERLLAAWGISRGRYGGERPAARMAGHPLSAGDDYHRGHAIPHRLGGPTDINLVPQLGRINVGAFRRLENAAVNTPGALYFTYWYYGASETQVPIACDQGLLVPGRPPQIRTHANENDG